MPRTKHPDEDFQFTPVLPDLYPPFRVKGTHGGRRPGAGAPKGNSNSLKHGLYSRRVYIAALMMAAVPELRLLITALAKDRAKKYHPAYRQAFVEAYRIVLADQELAKSIKALVQNRLQQHLSQVQALEPDEEIFRAINQSRFAGQRRSLKDSFR